MAHGHGRPFELMVMNCLKNLLLGLAFVGCWPRYSRMAMVICVFLVTLPPHSHRHRQFTF